MRRRSKIAIAAGFGTLCVVAVMLVMFQDPDRYREEVAALIADAAGYPVNLEGPLSLSWRPSPNLVVTRVSVVTPTARVRLDSVRISVDPAALLTRRLRADEVSVQGVHIDLASRAVIEGDLAIPDPRQLPVSRLVITEMVVRRDDAVVLRVARAELREPESPRGARVDVNVTLGSAAITGKVRLRVGADRIRLDELALDTPFGAVEGRLMLTPGKPVALLEGELSADAITLGPRLGAPPGGVLAAAAAFDLAPLAVLDVSVKARIGRLNFDGFRVSDLTVPVIVEQGRLRSDATATIATGIANATLEVDAASAQWSLAADVASADAGDALGMLGVHSAERGGTLDAHLQLEASGADIAALTRSLSGEISVDAAQFHLRSGVAKLAGADLLASMTRLMRGADGSRISVECAVARFAVRDGVLTSEQGLGAQTRATNVLGGGSLSLPREHMEFVFHPWPREGLGLSASTALGAVSVSGPLADPRVGLTSEAAIRGGATAGAAFLTGGLSLLAQGLFERSKGDAPCQSAASAAASTGSVSEGVRRAGAAGSEAADAVTDAVKDVGRTLEGLFGGSGARSAPRQGGSEQ